MYDEAIEALMNEQPELAIELIQKVMEEDQQFQLSPQEELDFERSIDFIPSNGWEAA